MKQADPYSATTIADCFLSAASSLLLHHSFGIAALQSAKGGTAWVDLINDRPSVDALADQYSSISME